MKKSFIFVFFIFFISYCFATSRYQITNVTYDLQGSTREYVLDTKIKIDKERIFENEDALLSYIEDYKQRLDNTRTFESINVDFTVSEPNEDDICFVDLFVTTKDSLHFLAMPYPSFNSNSGFKFKLKAKDTNFLGSMEEMSGDLNFAIETEENKDPEYKFGFNIDFDTPFKLGLLDVNWMNSHEFSYTIGETTPEWNLKTGLEFVLPLEKCSINFNFYQSFIRDLDYEEKDINGEVINYGDGTYFVEKAEFSIPFIIQDVPNWGKIYYKPYVDLVYNWDFDGIHAENKDLTSPVMSIGQTISTSRVDWIDNFRTGFSLSLTQSFSSNFYKNDFIPGIKGELQAFKSLKYLGLCTDIYMFAYLNGSEKIGGRLRGIRDDQYFSSESGNSKLYACETPAAIVVNFDIPIKLFATNWAKVPLINKISLMKYLNFELQVSPFIDIALTHNKATDSNFSLKDGFYAGGLEVLVFPQKWKGMTVRASLGVDLGRLLLKGKINQDWRDSVSKYELTIGLGLHY